MEEPFCYTLSQAAKLMQVSEMTIRRRIKEGLIPRSKVSGRILIPASWFKKEFGLETINKID